MKKIILILFLLSPAIANSQQNLDPEVMQQLQEMMTCMATIDQNEMKQLEVKGKKLESEVKALCKKGKRDEAQNVAMKFSKDMMKSQAVIDMQKCTEKVPESLKGMVPDMSSERIAKEFKEKSICDQM